MKALIVVAILLSTTEPQDSIKPEPRISNRLKMTLCVMPMAAEAGAVVSYPIGCLAGWAATGCEVTQTTDCVPSCGEPVINYPVLYSVVGIGAAGCGVLGGTSGYGIGHKVDHDLAVAECQMKESVLEKKPGQLALTHIWYLGAGGYEYGYNLNRFRIFRCNYVLPMVRCGVGFVGPSYHLESKKWGTPILSLLAMPYADPYQIADIDFIRTLYLYLGLRPSQENVSIVDLGLGFSLGSGVTLKGGAYGVLGTPTLYGGVEVELGSWFYSARFKPRKGRRALKSD